MSKFIPASEMLRSAEEVAHDKVAMQARWEAERIAGRARRMESVTDELMKAQVAAVKRGYLEWFITISTGHWSDDMEPEIAALLGDEFVLTVRRSGYCHVALTVRVREGVQKK